MTLANLSLKLSMCQGLRLICTARSIHNNWLRADTQPLNIHWVMETTPNSIWWVSKGAEPITHHTELTNAESTRRSSWSCTGTCSLFWDSLQVVLGQIQSQKDRVLLPTFTSLFSTWPFIIRSISFQKFINPSHCTKHGYPRYEMTDLWIFPTTHAMPPEVVSPLSMCQQVVWRCQPMTMMQRSYCLSILEVCMCHRLHFFSLLSIDPQLLYKCTDKHWQALDCQPTMCKRLLKILTSLEPIYMVL